MRLCSDGYCYVDCLQTLNLNRKVKTTNYTAEDLEPDVEYEFRVSAENSIGTSEPTVSNPLKYGQSGTRRLNLRKIMTAVSDGVVDDRLLKC